MSLKIKRLYLYYNKYADILRSDSKRILTLNEVEDIASFLSCPFNGNIDIENVAQKLNNFLGTTNLTDMEEKNKY